VSLMNANRSVPGRRHLAAYDGWVLSTSADALPVVRALCPPGVRAAAWHRGERPTLAGDRCARGSRSSITAVASWSLGSAGSIRWCAGSSRWIPCPAG
jgi:hypothetical protein